MKTLRYISMAILTVVLCVNFAACSDDDEETTESDNLTEIIVGIWAQDGDDDILVIKADGTGVIYGDETLYEKGEGDSFTWSYNNGWVYAGVAGIQEEELRPESVSSNKIVWRRYGDYDTGTKDAFGWYDLWTWERYTK